MKAIIYDDCPNFKDILNDDKIITRKDMTFKELCDLIDEMNISKENVYIYNKKMERVCL